MVHVSLMFANFYDIERFNVLYQELAKGSEKRVKKQTKFLTLQHESNYKYNFNDSSNQF